MKNLPKKLGEPLNGYDLDMRAKINEIIDYLAERDRDLEADSQESMKEEFEDSTTPPYIETSH